MKNLVLGVLAHVDAGKTTLCERLLYGGKTIRSFGRVDKGESFLDYDALERKRGITVFSKEAFFYSPDGKSRITLLDTPGHMDFVWQTLGCLRVMDGALLVIDASSRLSAQTKRLYKLLLLNNIPVFIFLNKTDMEVRFDEDIISALSMLGGNPVDFSGDYTEEVASVSEELMEKYISGDSLSLKDISDAIKNCLIFPVFKGSALSGERMEILSESLFKYVSTRDFPKNSFIPYRISHDEKGNLIVHGRNFREGFKAKEILDGEKVDEIRRYNGKKFQPLNEAEYGQLVGLKGPKNPQVMLSGFGAFEPLVEYRMVVSGGDSYSAMQALAPFLVEEPKLGIHMDAQSGNIHLSPMGEVQLEILKEIFLSRFGLSVDFERAGVVYKETIEAPVTGHGHFEPLRHYADCVLYMEPNPGGGIIADSRLPTDVLDKNWQNQILNVILTSKLKGVLTGAELIDVKFSLVDGKSHLKHTEGGDFREATIRGYRRGLMDAKNILLEPLYSFEILAPSDVSGKILSRLVSMKAQSEPLEYQGENVVLKGNFPVNLLSDFPTFVASVTSGAGELSLEFGGYIPCENQEEIVETRGYDARTDVGYSPDSVYPSFK